MGDSIWAEEVRGRTFALFGELVTWPGYHDASPEQAIAARGGIVQKLVAPGLDYLVLGLGYDPNKKDARVRAEAAGIRILGDSELSHFMRLDLRDQSFFFSGAFASVNTAAEHATTKGRVEAFGGRVVEKLDGANFLVLGNGRGKGKAALVRSAEAMRKAGARLTILREHEYLDLVSDQVWSTDARDVIELLAALRDVVDRGRVARALQLLQRDAFELFCDLGPTSLSGVVRSQSREEGAYAARVDGDGRYSCYDENGAQCMGLQGAACKHLLVLVIGLVAGTRMNAQDAYEWIGNGASKRPDESHAEPLAELMGRYRAAASGGLDWRPLETVPEDFYAM